jgi:hypothetical protein
MANVFFSGMALDFLKAQKWRNFIFDQLMNYFQEKREKRQTSKL